MSDTIEDDFDLHARINVRGRGTGALTKGRFEKAEIAYAPGEAQQVETLVYKDTSRSILAYNDSPDIGFSVSVNPYRGCEHGCIYCYARHYHEYLGLSAGLDFETKLFAKFDAPNLLRTELMAKSWKPQAIGMSGVTDCYQPIERKLEITRGCLKVLAEFRNPVVVISKNHLVTRDLDLLCELARFDAVHVCVTITTLDKELARNLEPRATQPERRLRTIEILSKAGIPVSVNMSPIIPGLTEHEIPTLLKTCAEAGARSANYNIVRLPHGVKDLFSNWLGEHYPLRRDKVLNRIKEICGGKLYKAEFGSRMTGEGLFAEHIAQMFQSARKTYNLNQHSALTTRHFRRPSGNQLSLFD